MCDEEAFYVKDFKKKYDLMMKKRYENPKADSLVYDLKKYKSVGNRISPASISGWIKNNKPISADHWSILVKFFLHKNISQKKISALAEMESTNFENAMSDEKTYYGLIDISNIEVVGEFGTTVIENRSLAVNYLLSVSRSHDLKTILNTHVLFNDEKSEDAYLDEDKKKIIEFFLDQIKSGCDFTDVTNTEPFWNKALKEDPDFEKLKTRYTCYHIQEIPVINAIVFKYHSEYKEVLFGWGYLKNTEIKENPIYLSNQPSLVAYFEDYIKALIAIAYKKS